MVRGCDGAEILDGYVQEFHGRRVCGFREAIDPSMLLHEVHSRFHIAMHDETAPRGQRLNVGDFTAM